MIKHSRYFFCVFSALLLIAGCATNTVKNTQSNIQSFAQISDVHFNPYFDPLLVPQLLTADAGQWEKVLVASSIQGFGTPGKDETNYRLLVSTLQSIAKAEPEFLVFTGDFLAHDFDSQFGTYAKQSDDYSSFVQKTITFVIQMLNKYVPQTKVYFCLGNNDCDTGDYQIVPDGAFLHNTASVFANNLIQDAANKQLFMDTYPVGGYYMVKNAEKQFIISLNSNFFSVKYQNQGSLDPGAVELDWFTQQLAAVHAQNGKVWLLLHIPPGANVFTVVAKQQYNAMWNQAYNDRFISIIQANSDIITAAFAGHTHMDDFRLLRTDQSAQAFIRICPAISPQFNNNPGYQQFCYNPQSCILLDYTAYWLNLEGEQTWEAEYTFSNAYGLNSITPTTLQLVYNNLESVPAVGARYIDYYNVSNPGLPVVTAANFTAYRCGIGNWTREDFTTCSGIK